MDELSEDMCAMILLAAICDAIQDINHHGRSMSYIKAHCHDPHDNYSRLKAMKHEARAELRIYLESARSLLGDTVDGATEATRGDLHIFGT